MHCNTMNAYALVAQRYMHEFGVPREDFAQVSLNGRRNAERNEKAVFRTPLTLDDYLSARMISTPLCLFDCDIPIDGATAVIVSHPSAAGEVRKPPLRVAAAGAARTSRVPWDQVDDLTTFANKDAAQQLWSRTDLTPADVDVALLYDGYSIITVSWIEGLGFCGRGEAGQFLRDLNSPSNHRELVVNPHGGHLSEGRTHGYGFIYEAAAQLWGEAGARQVGHDPEVAVATSGGMHGATCLLLTR
jgi:acetyl-CoA acetyltransferase